MKVILSKGAVQIFFIATSTYQREGSCSKGDSGVKVWVAVPSYVDMWLCDGTSWVIDTRLSVLKQFMEHREIMEHASCTVHFLPRVPLKGCFFYRAVKIVQQQRASQDKGRSHKATNSPINNVGLLQRSLEHT